MLKTITFTLMHFCIAFSVAYALTGSVAVGGLVAAVRTAVQLSGLLLARKDLEAHRRQQDRQGQHSTARLVAPSG